MRSSLIRSWLMASAGVVALSAGPALAQQDGQCAQRLDQMERQLQQADVAEQRRADVQLVIDGARTLAETGDEQGCARVLAELETLMQTVAGAGQGQEQSVQSQQTAQGQQAGQNQQAGQQAQQASQPQSGGQAQQPAQDQGQQAAGQGQQTAEGEGEMTARLTIEQPQPQVTVHQQPPKVTVRIPKPIITIRMPPPEVSIQMPEPDVQVEVPEPDIRVSMAQPDLQVEGAETQASADQDQQIQANVEYQGAQQQKAQVDVQMEEPEIRFEQAEPQIDIAGGASQDQQPAGQQAAASGQQQAAAPTQQAAAQEPTPAEEIAGASDVPTPDHQVRQSIDEAQMALQQDDVETARGALEDAQQNIQQVADQTGDDAQLQVGQVEQSIQQALDALEQDDVDAAQQALEQAKVPMQQAMLEQPPEQRSQSGEHAETAVADSERQTSAAAGGEESGEAAESPLAQIPASDLLGSQVVNDQGDTVAEIVDIVKRSDDETVYAVLSVGGFLGIGAKDVAMPLDRLDVGADQDIVLSNATEEELQSMPAWQKDDPAYESFRQ
jgi:hypothetical protein